MKQGELIMKKLMLPLALLLSQATLAKVEVSGFITPSLKFGSDSASDSYKKTLEMIDAGVTFEGEIKENLSATIELLADQENLDQADAAMKLREEAAKLDADAIIFVTFKNSDASWTGTKSIEAKGKAIRFSRY